MFSTKGRYALRVMIDLAQQNSEEFVPLKDIAERQDLSKKYLEIIVKDMVSAGLIIGTSGKGGGYRLSRPADDYTIGEIIEATEGSLSPVACLANEKYDCKRKEICKTLPMWIEYDKMIHDFFYTRKLSDIAANEIP